MTDFSNNFDPVAMYAFHITGRNTGENGKGIEPPEDNNPVAMYAFHIQDGDSPKPGDFPSYNPDDFNPTAMYALHVQEGDLPKFEDLPSKPDEFNPVAKYAAYIQLPNGTDIRKNIDITDITGIKDKSAFEKLKEYFKAFFDKN